MPITTSQMDAFEDAIIDLIRDALTAAGESSVQCAVGPLGDDSELEYIQSLSAPSIQDWSTLGAGRKRENMEIRLEIKSELAGGGEDVIKDVRDRVSALQTIVEEALRTGVNVPDVGPIRRVQVDGVQFDPQRGVGADRTSRVEARTITVTGLADLYIT